MNGMKQLSDPGFVLDDAKSIHSDRDSIVPALDMQGWDDWYCFTVVRDPVRRFLSFYSNKIRVNSIHTNLVTSEPRKRGYYNNMGLDEAIEVTVNGKFPVDPHVVVQSTVIDETGIDLNHIGRLEDIDQSIEKIADDTGLEMPAFHLNTHDRLPLLVSRSQFQKLTKHYEEDVARFGYTNDYDEWLSINVTGHDNAFSSSQGFVFENEATLLDYQIETRKNQFVVKLEWQVDPQQDRYRVARLVVEGDKHARIVKRLPRVDSLLMLADQNGRVSETFEIPFSELASDVKHEDLFFVVFFWKEGKAKKAILKDSPGANRVSFPLFVS